MRTPQQLKIIRQFQWLCSDLAINELGGETQIKKLRQMASEASLWIPEKYEDLFHRFAHGENIKNNDPIASARYLSSLFCADSFDQLIIDYPNLYSANFTFCVPDSWRPVIGNLSAEINAALERQPGFSIEISDVKEKFGRLRFYFTLIGPESGYAELEHKIASFINQAEKHICTLSRFEHRSARRST